MLPDRIPNLSGTVLFAYRLVWIVALIAALASIALSIPGRVRIPIDDQRVAPSGLVFAGSMPEGILVRPISDEARRAGLGPGDLLLRIDRRPVPDLAAAAAAVEQAEGPALEVVVRNPQGRLQHVTLTRDAGRLGRAFAGSGLDYRLQAWVLFAAWALGLSLVPAGILLFLRRVREPVVALLSFGFVLNGVNPTAFSVHAPLWLQAMPLGLSVLSMMLGLLFFPDGRLAPRWWPLGVFACFALAATLVVNVLTGNAFPLAFVITAPTAMALVAIAITVRFVHMPPGPARQQIKFAALGIVGMCMLEAIAATLLTMAGGASDYRTFVWLNLTGNVIDNLSAGLLIAGLLISLLRYRLYDADRVISRSVSFGVLTLILLAVFAGSEKVIELLGEEYFGEKLGVLAGGIGAALAAAMIVPLHHRLSHWAEHKFQKQLIRLRVGLPLLVGDMRQTAPVARIAAATLDSVTHGVRASRAALIFDGAQVDARGIEPGEVERWRSCWHPPQEAGFDSDRADVLFPLRVPLEADGHGRIGWLLLGPRPDGSFYGKDECKTLAEIADPVARALEVARTRERREAEERAAWAEQRTLNQALLGTLQALDDKLDRLLPPAAAAE